MSNLGGGSQGFSGNQNRLGYRLGQDSAVRRTLRLSWKPSGTNYNDVKYQKATTASSGDYTRYARERAINKNYNDNAL
jgi:hypothetical protein